MRKTPRPTETERDFGRWLNDAARMFAWRFAHFRPAQTKYGWRTAMEGDEGWPDYVLVRPPRLIIAELKRERRPSAVDSEQKIWLQQLGQVPGIECYLWTPDQRDEILLCLALSESPATIETVRQRFRELTDAVAR